MDRENEHHDGPTHAPEDADEERARLVADAVAAGVDEDDALRIAEEVAHGTPLADAYRAVDRRIASGATLEEAEHFLVDQDPGEDPGGTGDADR